jgi:hypothetical protein
MSGSRCKALRKAFIKEFGRAPLGTSKKQKSEWRVFKKEWNRGSTQPIVFKKKAQ